jgi:hypothetical protein
MTDANAKTGLGELTSGLTWMSRLERGLMLVWGQCGTGVPLRLARGSGADRSTSPPWPRRLGHRLGTPNKRHAPREGAQQNVRKMVRNVAPDLKALAVTLGRRERQARQPRRACQGATMRT